MIKVACIGDSITWGFTLLQRNKNSYPAVLQKLLGEDYEVKNFGFCDATARMDSEVPYTKRRVYKQALAYKADIALLMLGTNDTKHINWDPDKFRDGYSHIVDSLIAGGSRVVIMTPPRIFPKIDLAPFRLHNNILVKNIIPQINQIARERALEVLDVNSIMKKRSLFTDGIHPDVEGASRIANFVYEYMKSHPSE